MNRWMLTAAALAVTGTVAAKLPPPDEATKAKAAEAAAKTAWQGKVDAFKLCQVQDKIASKYKSAHPAEAKPAPPATAAPTPAATAAVAAKASTEAASAAHQAGMAAPTPAAAKPATPPVAPAATTTASQGGSTPVAAVVSAAPPVPPCADPGPFAYAPPEQKPLETSGAHSPAATATGPPSTTLPQAASSPAK